MKFFKSTLASIIGSLIGGGILLFLLFLILSNLFTPSSPELELTEPVYLKMELKGPILEKADATPVRMQGLDLPELGGASGLYEITQGLKAASEDDMVAGIYLRIRNVDAGWAKMTTLREALLDFKAAGKKIVAWSDSYDERSLYLASVADELYLHPVGDLELNGFAATPYYLANMFEKFDLEVNAFRVGNYKSGIEPFTETEMSPANREQLTLLLRDIWNEFQDSLAASRGISSSQIDQWAGDIFSIPDAKAAQEKDLISATMGEDEVLYSIKYDLGEEEKTYPSMTSFRKYMNARVQPAPFDAEADKIAVIFLEGTIVGGGGGSGQIGGDKFAKEIRRARLDSTVKAIVLRINSPGGSSLASDLIAEEIKITKKPIIASMSDVAASGGYYIAAPCDYIFARPQTITGSIGVYALSYQTHGFLEEQVGVNYDRVVTHPSADMMSPNRPMTDDEKAVIQAGVERTYATFLDIVQAGRKFPGGVAHADSLAQGRVWSGVQARQNGLIDAYGGLDEAIAYAEEKAGLTDPQLWLLPAPDNTFQQLASALSVLKIDASLLGPELKKAVDQLEEARNNHWKPGIYMRMDMDLDIR